MLALLTLAKGTADDGTEPRAARVLCQGPEHWPEPISFFPTPFRSYETPFGRSTDLCTSSVIPLPPLEQSCRQQKRAEGLSRRSKASKSIKHHTLFSVIQYLFPWKQKWQPRAFCRVVITLVAAHGSHSVPVSCSHSEGQP